MLVGPHWLIILVDGGENKVTYFQLTNYSFAATHRHTNWVVNTNSSRGRNGYDFEAFE